MKTTLVLSIIISGFMWYVAIGNLAHTYLGAETGKLWAACRAEQRVQILNSEPARTCSTVQFSYDPTGIVAAALVWPVAVPITYAMRNPIEVAIIVPSFALFLVGGIILRISLGRLRSEKYRRLREKERVDQQKALDADASLEREAPEFSKSLVSR